MDARTLIPVADVAGPEVEEEAAAILAQHVGHAIASRPTAQPSVLSTGVNRSRSASRYSLSRASYSGWSTIAFALTAGLAWARNSIGERIDNPYVQPGSPAR